MRSLDIRRLGTGAVAVLLPLALAYGCAATPSHAASTTGNATSPATSSATSSSTSPAAAATASKPNVVFVLTDDLQPNLLRYMPNVRALQARGANFSNYFVVDSLCCPSRSATLTGQYAHNNGVFTNTGSDGGYATFKRRGNEKHTFGVALQKAGYRTGFMGKYLNGYQPKTDGVPVGWNEWDVAGNGYPEFNYDLNQNGKVQHYGKQPQAYLTDVLSGKATSFIDTSVAAKKPFALEVATFAPHAPSTPAPRDKNAFPGLKAPRTKAYNRLPTDPPKWLKGRPALTTKQQADIDAKFRKRAQSVLAVDKMIGHLTEVLKAKGQLNNTYFVFSSDNGFHMGEYRLNPGKQTAFDTDIHVPLVITGPGIKAGSTISALASNIDLAPTFTAMGKTSMGSSAKVDGANLMPLFGGKKPSGWRDALLVEHHGPNTAKDDPDRQSPQSGNPPTYNAIRTANATYVAYADGDKEYYNLTKDPYELANKARSASAKTLKPLQKALKAMTTCAGQESCRKASQIG